MIAVAGLYFDNQYEIGLCSQEFEQVSGLSVGDAFANEDYWQHNFGNDVDCVVFWNDDFWLASVNFKLGTLTPELVESSIYWG